MPLKSYRKESKIDWGLNASENYKMNNVELKLGAMLRIADATEVMAQNHIKLQADRDMYKRWYEDENRRRQKLERSNAALRGVINKMKKAKQ